MLTDGELHRFMQAYMFLLLAVDERTDAAATLAEQVGYEDMMWALTTIALAAIADATGTDTETENPDRICEYLRKSLLALACERAYSNN